MEGDEVASFLYDVAKELPDDGAIVECGSWLGGSIAPVAQALADTDSRTEIHCYDRWEANAIEVTKAAEQGVTIDKGQDTLPLFSEYVDDIYPKITPHKTDLLEASWDEKPIRLFIDDASKDPRVFNHVMRTFGPSFVPDETIVVLMDYNMYKKTDGTVNKMLKRCQKDFVESNSDSFERIIDFDESSGAVFKYKNPVDWSKPILQTPFQRIYANTGIIRWITWKIINLGSG